MSKYFNKILYLGPQGSYSDIAKEHFKNFYSETCEYIPVESITRIANKLSVEESANVAAIVPIENSVEGIVRETQDKLAILADNGWKIAAETTLKIEHSLIGYASNIQEIETIISYPQALAQCREFILNTFQNGIIEELALSTSESVLKLSKNNHSKAAIASRYCAELYRVPIIKESINDEKNNTTRFILLSKKNIINNDYNKVSLLFSTENKSGALNKVLSVLEEFEINMTYIDSRPSRKKLGEYVFFVDFVGKINDTNVALALTHIQPLVKHLKLLSHE